MLLYLLQRPCCTCTQETELAGVSNLCTAGWYAKGCPAAQRLSCIPLQPSCIVPPFRCSTQENSSLFATLLMLLLPSPVPLLFLYALLLGLLPTACIQLCHRPLTALCYTTTGALCVTGKPLQRQPSALLQQEGTMPAATSACFKICSCKHLINHATLSMSFKWPFYISKDCLN